MAAGRPYNANVFGHALNAFQGGDGQPGLPDSLLLPYTFPICPPVLAHILAPFRVRHRQNTSACIVSQGVDGFLLPPVNRPKTDGRKFQPNRQK
jgi:hypothetical protein